MKKAYTGIVDKIRVIQSFPNLMARFTLHTNDGPINCIITQESQKFLFLNEGRSEIAAYGHYNQRNQFVIEKYMLRNSDQFLYDFTKMNVGAHK